MTGVLCAVMVLVGGCTAEPADQVVRAREIVVGRARAGRTVWLLTNTARLVHLSVSTLESGSSAVTGLRGEEELWGLARTDHDSLLTMLGASMLGELATTGQVGRRWPLDRAHVGLHPAPLGFLLQPATLRAERRVLEWTRHPDDPGRAVGTLTLTWFGSRAETLARNLVGCGMTHARDVPCWFNHDSRVHRVSARGESRIVELGHGLNQGGGRGGRPVEERGPVVDAQVAVDDSLWVLLRDRRHGALTLVRYATDGEQTQTRRLEVDARLVLDVGPTRVLLLSREGYPVEVGVE